MVVNTSEDLIDTLISSKPIFSNRPMLRRALSTRAAGTETTEQTTSETQPEAKYLTARGVLREISRESTSKGLYRITREDRWICIVKSGTLDLGAYTGKAVQVWGLETPSEGWSLRTINVSRVKLQE